MNKRQKKKIVKRAMMNILAFKGTEYDRHIMGTIGTNQKVMNELKSDEIAETVQDVVDRTISIMKPIFEAYVEAFKIVREKVLDKGRRIYEAREDDSTDDV